MPDTFTYDVFISHSSKDKSAARDLAERLKADGLRVWLAAWELRPGEAAGHKIQQGLDQSRTLVLVLSANVSESEWVTFESQTILFSDPANPRRRLIPLRLDDTEIRGTLKQFAFFDWRPGSELSRQRLLMACHPSSTGVEGAGTPDQPSDSLINKVLEGHKHAVTSVAITPDGRLAVSGSDDFSVRAWDLNTGTCLTTLKGHADGVHDVTVTPDGRLAASISGIDDGNARIWDLRTGECTLTISNKTPGIEAHLFRGLAVMRGQIFAASMSVYHFYGGHQIWDLTQGKNIAYFNEEIGQLLGIGRLEDRLLLVSTSLEFTVWIWDLYPLRSLAVLRGHSDDVKSVAFAPDGRLAVSGSKDKTVRLWDLASGKCLFILEGHSATVNVVTVTGDSKFVVSGSEDKTVKVWDPRSGECVLTLSGHTDGVTDIAVAAEGRRLVSGSRDRTVRVWDLPNEIVARGYIAVREKEAVATRYTNAKVLLIGDTGVGKTGLAYRLTEDRFVPTISTDGAWATQLKLPLDAISKEIEREIWLWDFAGQADYRLIHQLFMDETSLAVLVFNPQSDDPFEGLGQWDRDLQRAARRTFKKLLVAGRCDRGGLMVSRNSIERFRKERGFDDYLETSAYTGDGCAELRDAIVSNIPWDEIPWTSSPRIFKLLKEEIVKLKDEGKVLLRMGELKQHLEMRLPEETFTLEHLRAVVGLLAGPGVVWQLEFGDFVLLQPERINAYAAAVIRKVRAHTEEIGVILEEDVLAGKLDYQNMKRLPPDEEHIVLRAMHQTFVDHGLCLREPTETGTLLVFPSYFKRERPDLEGHPAVFVAYQFNGQLDEIYSTLIVRLHYTTAFEKDQLWRFAADLKTQGGKRLGLKMNKQGEGAAEISVYFGPGVPDETKVTFIKYVHEHLKVKANDVVRLRHYVCTQCNTAVENRKTALDRLDRGLKDILCVNCESRILLWDLIEKKFASEEFQRRARELEEQARISIDNESKELILVGHAFAIAGEAGQIFRPTPNSDWGIDGELEFKNNRGEASGSRVYLQLKSGDSYLQTRKADGKEVFTIRKPRQAEYWLAQAYPVMLVVRTSDGKIRWMDVTDYLRRHGEKTKQVVFDGEPFTALSVVRLRDRLLR